MSSRKERQEKIPLNESDPEVHKEVAAFTTVKQALWSKGSHVSQASTHCSAPSPTCHVAVKEFKQRKSGSQESKDQRPGSTKKATRLRNPIAKELQQAMTVIVRTVQRESLGPELSSTLYIGTKPAKGSGKENGGRKRALKGSPLYQLNPFDDSDVIVRVGGRLRRARLEYGEKQFALLPRSHHLANLVVRHYHSQVRHQGRLITHGASRLLAHRRSQDSSQRIE